MSKRRKDAKKPRSKELSEKDLGRAAGGVSGQGAGDPVPTEMLSLNFVKPPNKVSR